MMEAWLNTVNDDDDFRGGRPPFSDHKRLELLDGVLLHK